MACGINHEEEWVWSISDETMLNTLVVHGMLPNRTTTGWHPTFGAEFPTPCSDELVVFEDYFYWGFGVPIHPFLHGLINNYKICLCNLSPNSILRVAIFINFCEAYLGILPYFDLFRHFFCLKIRGGSRCRVVGGAYLQLWDGMGSQYITIPLNTHVKY